MGTYTPHTVKTHLTFVNHYSGKDNKAWDSDASFPSVTAAIEPVNCCWIRQVQLQQLHLGTSRTILATFSGSGVLGGERGGWPFMCALCTVFKFASYRLAKDSHTDACLQHLLTSSLRTRPSKEGLVNWLGWKCTLRPVCRRTSDWLLISILMCVN